MTSLPSLQKISLPSSIDLSAGPATLNIDTVIDYGGSGKSVPGLYLYFSQPVAFATPGYLAANFSFVAGGDLNLRSLGATDDTFNDATPNSARTTISLSPLTSPGSYAIVGAFLPYDATPGIQHEAGFYPTGTWYDADQLKALGLDLAFTVLNSHAPAAPTEALGTSTPGFFAGNQLHIGGTAQPGVTVEVDGNDLNNSSLISFGQVQADAQGKWALTSQALADGSYTGVVARAVDGAGNASAPSAATSFVIASKAPDAPLVGVTHDAANHVVIAQPLFWGSAAAGDTVRLVEGATLLGSTTAAADGSWHILPAALANGAHTIDATVLDAAGRTSASTSTQLVVDAQAGGIRFTVGALANLATTHLDAASLQHTLDQVGAVFSSVFDGAETIPLAVSVTDIGAASASAAASWTGTTSGGLPLVQSAVLNISPNFSTWLADPDGALSPSAIDTLVHEMTHALGFNNNLAAFHQFVSSVNGASVFTGAYASALNHGPVALDASLSHLLDTNDVMSSGGGVSTSANMAAANSHAPLSALDIAILKDLGYVNRSVIVSEDGHSFVPGDGKAGNNNITGSAGIDTVVMNAPAANFTVQHTDTGFTLADKVGAGGTNFLSGIERIAFSDSTLALDTSGNGGQAYRLYQAAFNRTPDAAGDGYWILQLDNGASLRDVAYGFTHSAEFTALYGANPTDQVFVTKLYDNVLHRAPDGDGYAFWIDGLAHGASREDVLVNFSESKENQAQVIGSIQDGFAFTPYHG